MLAKQPKKGKGKKVTVVPDPASAPPPAPAAAPNPEVQAVLDAHIANVGSEHFPAGYFPIPYTLTPPDVEPSPSPPPLRQPLEATLFGKWDQPGNPYLVWRIDATRVNFALTKGGSQQVLLCRDGAAPHDARGRVEAVASHPCGPQQDPEAVHCCSVKRVHQRFRAAGDAASGSGPRGTVAVGGSSQKKWLEAPHGH